MRITSSKIFFSLIALICIFIIFNQFYNEQKIYNLGGKAEGVISAVDRRGISYWFKVENSIYTGFKLTITTEKAVGNKIVVYYEISNPKSNTASLTDSISNFNPFLKDTIVEDKK